MGKFDLDKTWVEAADFRKLLEKHSGGPLLPWLRPESDEESTYVRALLLILREPEFAKERLKLRQFMVSALKASLR